MKLPRVALSVVCAIALLLSVSGVMSWHRYRSTMNELYAFRTLAHHAREMIDTNAEGVIELDGQTCILNMDALSRYVVSVEPNAGAGATPENPFPAILPGERYKVWRNDSDRPNRILLGSNETHRLGGTKHCWTLCANGKIVNTLQEDKNIK